MAAMTHEIPRDANTPSDGTGQDFAAQVDQWADKNWYLPPGGDHSWREREAERRFGSENSSHENADPPPVAADGPAVNEMDGAYDPGFKRTWALNVLLPVSLATCAVAVAIAILMPGVWRSGFWGPSEPKALPDAPLRVIDTAGTDENVTARLAAGSDLRQGKQETVNQALPQPIGQAVVPPEADQKTALPQLRTQVPFITKQDRQNDKPAARVAKAVPAQASKKPAAKSLPPIGEAYFASHAPAAREQAATPSSPIGQAYFESHSSARAN